MRRIGTRQRQDGSLREQDGVNQLTRPGRRLSPKGTVRDLPRSDIRQHAGGGDAEVLWSLKITPTVR